MRNRTRHRLISWFALLGLLFQQFAMAAYVCPGDLAGTLALSQQHSVASDCHEMAMSDPARCGEHCNPHQASTTQTPVMDVTPSLLPAVQPALVVDAGRTAALACWQHAVERRAAPPPLNIRDCSFQF